jgi:tetratricopeptide (TPR) repeat protein/CHAT domain-containing protein
MNRFGQSNPRKVSLLPFFWATWLFLAPVDMAVAQGPDGQFNAALEAARYADAEQTARKQLEQATNQGNESDIALWSSNLARVYYMQGRYAEAEPLYKRALAFLEKARGPDHPAVAMSLINLALVYRAQGRYAEAEPLYRRALAIFEKARGPDHPDVASSLNGLALVYGAQGRYAEAEPLHKRALGIREKALGPDHPAVVRSLIDLAEVYRAQGRCAEAEPLHKRALGIRERALGPDHPDVASSLNGLALVYGAQGRYAEAEPLCRRALAIFEKARGPDHPDVASSLNGLAGVYYAQGRYAEAEPLYRRALGIREKARGPDHPAVASSLNNLAGVYYAQGRYAEAEPLHKRALGIREKALGPDHPALASSLNDLAGVYRAQGRYAEAEPLHKRALGIREKALGPDHPDVASSLNDLALVYGALGRYAEAEPLHKRALEIREKALGPDHPAVAVSLINLAGVYHARGRYAEAEPLHKRALGIREKALGPDHPAVASSLNDLALVYGAQGHYAEAEPLHKRALGIREKALGPDHPAVAMSLINLAEVYHARGHYAEAEPLLKRALGIREKALGPDHPAVASSLNGRAEVYRFQGRYAEAEPLYRRALAIFEKALGPDHPAVATSLNNLALVYRAQGRYAEAEPLLKRALGIFEKALGPDHPQVARSLDSLAGVYGAQGRYAEAEPLRKRALAIFEKALGPDHPAVATSLNNLAVLYYEEGRYAEAEPLLKRALAIFEKALGPDHANVANSNDSLASVYGAQGRYVEAEPLRKRALAIFEKALGPDHPAVATSLDNLALVDHEQGRDDQAEPLLDRAIAIRDRAGVAPGERFSSYHLRAQIAWKAGRRGEAIADLRHALDLAEQQRGRSSGAEHERAGSFARFARAFERMVAWQIELGDAGEAFQAIERAHARSLLDEIGVAGADLTIGRTLAEREQARQREGELRSRIAGSEKQVAQARDAGARARLQSELAEARAALYQHYRDERSSSPVYHNLLSAGGGPPRLSQVQRRLPADSLLLAYLVGEEDGFVLIAGPGSARVIKLAIPEAEARALGISAGPLTAKRLQTILVGEKNDGLVTRLADPSSGAENLTSRLASLWRVLVPEAERRAILTGKVKWLVIIPDGPLALLPFEALVAEESHEPKYLLDAGPPVLYAPSATVLYNLAERPPGKPAADREPVLAVGDPAYGEAGVEDPAPTTSALAALTSRSRYSSVGGRLSRLPYTGWEIAWVARTLGDAGIKVGSLSRTTATERGVRHWSPGRRVLHLACHGLADQQHGNFFGALALTPGPKGSADPADDGFLTLAEIYELNLKGTELTILSACQTNYGPRQEGEGTWALSRGFLVAGSRRVVASNWLVDDEAGASLVGVFCGGLARDEKVGKPVDHAAALQEAKRWVRQQEKWKSPYYWASMVLVGPP